MADSAMRAVAGVLQAQAHQVIEGARGEPLTGHNAVVAVAAGALPDGTPVIISGGRDGTVRVWRTADGTRVVPPLDLPESIRAVGIDGDVIITAAGADIAVHELALPRTMR